VTTSLGIVDGSLDPVTHVVEPSGELDLATSPDLEACLDNVFESGKRRVIVDLGEVSFIDSTGLRALCKAQKRLAEAGGTMVVVCGDTNVRRVFDVSGLVDVLRVVESRRNAIALASGQ
jgi:anti-sigma B factor antagonist